MRAVRFNFNQKHCPIDKASGCSSLRLSVQLALYMWLFLKCLLFYLIVWQTHYNPHGMILNWISWLTALQHHQKAWITLKKKTPLKLWKILYVFLNLHVNILLKICIFMLKIVSEFGFSIEICFWEALFFWVITVILRILSYSGRQILAFVFTIVIWSFTFLVQFQNVHYSQPP